jgi:hypothetical protein
VDSGLGRDAMSHQARTRAQRHTDWRGQHSLVHKNNEASPLHLYYNAGIQLGQNVRQAGSVVRAR